MVNLSSLFLRGAIIGLLLAGQVGLAVWFGADVHRTTDPETVTRGDLLAGGEDFVGQTIVVTGSVVQVDPVQIELQEDGTRVRLTILALEPSVSVSDRVRVRGEMVAADTVHASQATVVPRWRLWYVWGISFLAGLWVILRLARQWRVDAELSLVPRNRHKRDNETD